MADEEKQHRAELRTVYIRRKRLLELRKARQGERSEPALDMELEEVRASLHLLDLADAPKASAEAQAAAGGNENILALAIAQLGKFGERLTGVETKVDAVDTAVAAVQHEAAVWREEHGKAHVTEGLARLHGQHIRIAVEVGFIVLVILIWLTR